MGLIWRLTYYVAHLSRDLPSLTIARWCDMEDKIALIAPGGVFMAEFLEPASHRQACRSGRCLTASYQQDRARGSVHHADIALWLGGVSSAWVCSSGSISSRITTWKIETDALRGMLGKALRW